MATTTRRWPTRGRFDAAVVDAAPADASGLCDGAGEQLFTGDYVNWDSTLEAFLGVFDAEVFPVGQPERTVRTAPNGRSLLCLGPDDGDELDVAFSHPSYLPLVFAVDVAAVAEVGYTARGLTPARAASLFSDELSLTFDPAAAQVIVDLRQADGSPFTGATLAIAAAGAGGVFSTDAEGGWVAGGSQQAGGDGRGAVRQRPTGHGPDRPDHRPGDRGGLRGPRHAAARRRHRDPHPRGVPVGPPNALRSPLRRPCLTPPCPPNPAFRSVKRTTSSSPPRRADFRAARRCSRTSTSMHQALPECALDDVDLIDAAAASGWRPVIVAGMTGGTDEAAQINHDLARAAGTSASASASAPARHASTRSSASTFQVRERPRTCCCSATSAWSRPAPCRPPRSPSWPRDRQRRALRST